MVFYNLNAGICTNQTKKDTKRCLTAGVEIAGFTAWNFIGFVAIILVWMYSKMAEAWCAHAFDHGSITLLIWPTTTALPKCGRKFWSHPLKDFAVIYAMNNHFYQSRHRMWNGPYGEWGSRKYLLSSLDQSLETFETGLCRHLLFSPSRPQQSNRGNHGRSCNCCFLQGLYVAFQIIMYIRDPKVLTILQSNCVCPVWSTNPNIPCLWENRKRGLVRCWMPTEWAVSHILLFGTGLFTDRYLGGIPENSRLLKVMGFLQKEGSIKGQDWACTQT